MILSKETIDYLSSLQLKTINSNIIITDLKTIIYASTLYNDNYYVSKPISNDLIELIKLWNEMPITEDLFYMENRSNIHITIEDKLDYNSLIIFPLYLDNKISGLAIFFRCFGTYLKTSVKAPNSIRKWIMKFMGNEIFPVCKNIF